MENVEPKKEKNTVASFIGKVIGYVIVGVVLAPLIIAGILLLIGAGAILIWAIPLLVAIALVLIIIRLLS